MFCSIGADGVPKNDCDFALNFPNLKVRIVSVRLYRVRSKPANEEFKAGIIHDGKLISSEVNFRVLPYSV